ncbi:MAG: nucleoside hydrolase [Clostridia bacterium]|nr:nucleoside hydrolase [Clostridia bacterium]
MKESKRIEMLELHQGKVSVVLDTDTACEVDDQFAVAYAVRSAEAGELVLEGLHATQFSDDPADGMERSYQEIHKVLDLMGNTEYKNIVYRGADRKMTKGEPVMSDAVNHLIELAKDESREGPLYVVAIGSGTNIASALMAAPEIKEKIVLVWLAGNVMHWSNVAEYNIGQDITAAQYIFDSGVPLVLLPAYNVVEALSTTIYELEHFLGGKNDLCDFLVENVRKYSEKDAKPNEAWTKVIWDIAGIAYIVNPKEWFISRLIPTPILSDPKDWEWDMKWASDPTRPTMRIVDYVERSPIFQDVFDKLVK